MSFVTASYGHDLDPEVCIFWNRIAMMRRAVTKRPKLHAMAKNILKHYTDNQYIGTQAEDV